MKVVISNLKGNQTMMTKMITSVISIFKERGGVKSRRPALDIDENLATGYSINQRGCIHKLFSLFNNEEELNQGEVKQTELRTSFRGKIFMSEVASTGCLIYLITRRSYVREILNK